MGNTGYEIMSVERIINSTNQTYILSIRAPKQTQIKTDKHFEEEFSDFPELLGDVKMKRGKMYKIYSYVIYRIELILIRSHTLSCITIIESDCQISNFSLEHIPRFTICICQVNFA